MSSLTAEQPATQASRPIQAEQDPDIRVDFPQLRQSTERPSRCESDTRLVAVTQTLEQQQKIVIDSLQSEVKGLKELLYQAFQQIQSQHETQQELKSQLDLCERESTILQKGIEEREIRIQQLIKSESWLSRKLKEKEELLEILVNEDQFDKIYRFVEAKSNFLMEGNRCIVCVCVPDDSICVRKTPEGQQCNRPGKEHMQTLLGHKFKSKDKADKCNYKDQDGQLCGCPQVEHQDLQHNFKSAGLCESHLYPGGVLEVVCEGNNKLIYDGVHHTSRTPDDCKRRLICDQCEPVTSKLEKGLIDRMKCDRMETGAHSDVETVMESSDLHELEDEDDGILFSILAYRSMVFSLCHYQQQCCIRYRADIKAILWYGWRCHYQLRYPDPTCGAPTPPVLLYLQSPGDEIPRTLHLPAVCELDLTAIRPPTPPELGSTVVAIYGCIPPYHYLLLRDPYAAAKLKPYTQQIILSINRRLSHEMKTYYEKNDKAKCWLEGRRKQLGPDWWPVLTFGHLKCCLKI